MQDFIPVKRLPCGSSIAVEKGISLLIAHWRRAIARGFSLDDPQVRAVLADDVDFLEKAWDNDAMDRMGMNLPP